MNASPSPSTSTLWFADESDSCGVDASVIPPFFLLAQKDLLPLNKSGTEPSYRKRKPTFNPLQNQALLFFAPPCLLLLLGLCTAGRTSGCRRPISLKIFPGCSRPFSCSGCFPP